MLEEFYFVLSVAGAFAVLDALAPNKSKEKIADFVFGLHGVTVMDFEKSLVEIWVGLFFDESGFKWLRVVILCFSIVLIFLASAYSISGPTTGRWVNSPIFLGVLIGTSIPAQVLNLFVSRSIYLGLGRNLNPIFQFILDFVFSVGSTFMLGWGLFSLAPKIGGMAYVFGRAAVGGADEFMSLMLLMSLFSATIFLLMRGTIVIASLTTRALVTFTRINFEVAVWSNAYQNPLTYLALVFAGLTRIGFWIGQTV